MDEEVLRYFANESSSIERGSITSITEILSNENEFIVKTKHGKGRTYQLKAQSTEDRVAWVNAITKVESLKKRYL